MKKYERCILRERGWSGKQLKLLCMKVVLKIALAVIPIVIEELARNRK